SAGENEDPGIDEVAKSVDLLFLAVLVLGGNPDVNRRVLPQAGFRFSILRRVAIGPHKKVMRRLCKREGVVLEVSGVGGAPIEIVEPASAHLLEALGLGLILDGIRVRERLINASGTAIPMNPR